MKINWIDILIVAFIVWTFFIGKKRGFSVEIIALITAVLSWVISTHFYQAFGQNLNKWFMINLDSARALAFIIIAAASLFIITVLGKLLKKVMNLSFLPNLEKVGGCIAGTLRGIVLTALVVVGLALMPVDFIQKQVYTDSFFGNYFVALTPKVHNCVWPKSSGKNSKFKIGAYWSQLPQKPKGEIL